MSVSDTTKGRSVGRSLGRLLAPFVRRRSSPWTCWVRRSSQKANEASAATSRLQEKFDFSNRNVAQSDFHRVGFALRTKSRRLAAVFGTQRFLERRNQILPVMLPFTLSTRLVSTLLELIQGCSRKPSRVSARRRAKQTLSGQACMHAYNSI